MARLFAFLLWTVVFLLLMLAIDQLLVRVPASQPTHAAIAAFYQDLRARLFDLASGKPAAPAASPAKVAPQAKTREQKKPAPANIEDVIEPRQAPKPVPPPRTTRPAPAPPPLSRPAPEPATAPASIEAVIDQRVPGQAVAPARAKPPVARSAPEEPIRRYLYADEQGNLHFAGTLSEVPERYRDKARLVEE